MINVHRGCYTSPIPLQMSWTFGDLAFRPGACEWFAQAPPRLALPRLDALLAIGATFGPATLLYAAKMVTYLLVQVAAHPPIQIRPCRV